VPTPVFITSSPESDAGDWIIRAASPVSGARNIIVPVLKLVGWR
jgi:hypothetical protein